MTHVISRVPLPAIQKVATIPLFKRVPAYLGVNLDLVLQYDQTLDVFLPHSLELDLGALPFWE